MLSLHQGLLKTGERYDVGGIRRYKRAESGLFLFFFLLYVSSEGPEIIPYHLSNSRHGVYPNCLLLHRFLIIFAAE